jgi:hypothetical protein
MAWTRYSTLQSRRSPGWLLLTHSGHPFWRRVATVPSYNVYWSWGLFFSQSREKAQAYARAELRIAAQSVAQQIHPVLTRAVTCCSKRIGQASGRRSSAKLRAMRASRLYILIIYDIVCPTMAAFRFDLIS